jgi:hypothetical protein
MSLFGDSQIEAARQARRELIADMRLHELADKNELGAYNRKLIVAMFKAAEGALDVEGLVETAARAVAGENWDGMDEILRGRYREDTRAAFTAIGLLEPT